VPDAVQIIRRTLLSGFILMVLGTQTVAGFSHTDRWFPFLWYPMYAAHHEEGERLDVRHFLYAVAGEGREYEIRPEDLQMGFWRFEGAVINSVLSRKIDRSNEVIRRVLDLHPDAIALRVQDYPAAITRNGIKPLPSNVIAVVPVPQQGASF